jgi:RNA polymerase sigma-70 factor (ECF subfamily)
VRREASTVIAFLHRYTGDFDVAEEAVQDAVVTALRTWRVHGIPDRPGAWLTVAAKRRAIDLLRHRGRQDRVVETLAAQWPTEPAPAGDGDDRVDMLFGCCHPSLAAEARLALTLRAVVGLTTAQIAASFLVPEATLAQRVVRAKRKIVSAGIPLRIPEPHLMAQRLDDVLTVVCLTYNAGFLEPPSPGPSDTSLAADAVWLAGLVAARLPSEPEAWGLLALLTLQQSRAAARFDASGALVLLADQDRARWSHPDIARAEGYLERAALWRRPGRFQLQGAIAACHASAPTWASTDWLQILTLYDLLQQIDTSPVVALNRAVALAEYSGARDGLAAVEPLATRLSGYYLFHATRADLLRRLGRTDEAHQADTQALALAANPVEQNLLRSRLGR